MANEQDNTDKHPHFCISVLAENIGNTVDGQSQQQGPLGENKPSSNRDILTTIRAVCKCVLKI